MDIAQLLPELTLVADVAVIVALLPKSARPETLRKRQLEVVNGITQKSALGLVQQQVHVFWHNYVSVNAQAEAAGASVRELGRKGHRWRVDRILGASGSR